MIPAACNDLITTDHTDLCFYLNEQIRQVRIQPWITALISGLIGVVAAGLTAWFTHLGTSKLKKTERYNAAQRQALMDTQNGGVELRSRLIEWGEYLDEKAAAEEAADDATSVPIVPASNVGAKVLGRKKRRVSADSPTPTEDTVPGRVHADPFPAHAQENLTGKLYAHVSRINNARVGEAFKIWAKYAQLSYSGSEDHTLAEELRLWEEAMELAGQEQRRLDE